jgi:hypothetical protein
MSQVWDLNNIAIEPSTNFDVPSAPVRRAPLGQNRGAHPTRLNTHPMRLK